MRKKWAHSWAAVVVSTIVLMGCGRAQAPGSTGDARETEAPAQPDEISLIGCIGTASGTRDIVLQNIRFARTAGSQPQSESTVRGVTEGAWVRLAGADAAELVRHAGRQVRVRGELADDTRMTGTAGSENSATPSTGPGTPTPSGDRSQAATDQHHAAKKADEAGPIARDFLPPGPAPELRVREIRETGAQCSESPR
jgi:hypothetical protein